MNGIKRFFSAVAKYDFHLVLILLLGYFLFLLPDIALPGLNGNEAIIGLGTADILGAGRAEWCHSGVRFGARLLPIMNAEYDSSLLSYLLLPFSFFFGLNLFSIRLMSAAIAFVSLAYLYLLLRDWFGRQVALPALALIMSNPVFVIYHKMASEASEVYLACFFWAGLYHLYRYYSGRKRRHLIAAALFCGLGLNKITFLWYIAAVMAAAAVLYRSLAAKNIVNPRDLLCALPGFCVGGFLMIFYNLRNGFATVRYMLSRLVHPTRLGVDNLTYVANLKIRFGHLTRAMISGRDIGMGTGRQEILSPNVPVFVVSLLLLFLMAKKVNPSKKKKIVFLAVCLVVLLACSPITVSGLALNHLYVLFFLPPVLISVALVSLQEALPCKKAAVCLAGIPIALILASNIAVARRDILYLRATGGTTPYATAINGLASWLDANRIKEFVIVNSIAPSIEFLTGGRVGSLIERQVYDHQGFMGRFNDLLASGVCGVDFYFVLGQKVAKSNEGYYGEEFEELLSLAKGRRLNCRVVKIIEDKSGQPEYVVWKIFRDAPGRLAGAGRPAGAVCRRQAHAAFKAVATRSIAALSRPS